MNVIICTSSIVLFFCSEKQAPSPLLTILRFFLLWILLFLWSSKTKASIHFFKNITIHSQQISQHTKCVFPSGPYSTSTYLQHKIHVCVCIVHMLSCVFVLLHSPRCSIRCIFMFFKSNFTACMSYLMRNRVPCSHGSMQYCASAIFCSGLGLWRDLWWHVFWGMNGCLSCVPVVQSDSLVHSS